MRITLSLAEIALLDEGLDRLIEETQEFGIKMADSSEEAERNLALLAEINALRARIKPATVEVIQ